MVLNQQVFFIIIKASQFLYACWMVLWVEGWLDAFSGDLPCSSGSLLEISCRTTCLRKPAKAEQSCLSDSRGKCLSRQCSRRLLMPGGCLRVGLSPELVEVSPWYLSAWKCRAIVGFMGYGYIMEYTTYITILLNWMLAVFGVSGSLVFLWFYFVHYQLNFIFVLLNNPVISFDYTKGMGYLFVSHDAEHECILLIQT